MENFDAIIFEDRIGNRHIYCETALGAISGPGNDDVVIAKLSTVRHSFEPKTVDDIKESELILNLTQNPATPEQVAAGVVDLPADQRLLLIEHLTPDGLLGWDSIFDRCSNIASLAVYNGLGEEVFHDTKFTKAMIDGPSWLIRSLEDALLFIGIDPLHSIKVREIVNQKNSDGSIEKTDKLIHVGFAPGGSL